MSCPPDLDALGDLVTRAAAHDNGGEAGAPFSVRRFAGPLAHVDQLDHLRVAHLPIYMSGGSLQWKCSTARSTSPTPRFLTWW